MSALTDLKSRITGADGHLLDRTTIATELERAIAEENARAQTEGYWWCPNCVAEVHPSRVTLEELHQDCGARLEYMYAPEDLRHNVLVEVHRELDRQDAMWGQQNHDMADYYTILGEEFGEVGKAICESKLQKMTDRHEIRKELIQLAAVAVAMAESFDRQEAKK